MIDLATASEAELSARVSSISRQLRINRRVGRATVSFPEGKYIQLDFGRIGGKRLRRYAKSETAAYRLAWKITRELNEHGQLVKALTTAQRYQAAEAFRLLQPIGADLLDVVREHLLRHPLGGNARTLDDVRRELVDKKTKTKRRARYVRDLDYKLRKLIEAVGNKAVTAVTTLDLEDELDRHPDWKPTTVHSATQTWKVLLNYCVKRGYRTDNPAEKLELPVKEYPEPTILALDQAKRLMAATLFADRDPLLPACRAYLAIGMFAGIRPEEMVRLDWAQVDLVNGYITILGANAKCRARRVVDVAPNLRQWLQPIARPKGKVLPRPIAELRNAARAALRLPEWPHDVLRHTFASYHFGHHRNEALVKNQMGHSDDGRMFFHHYRVMVYPADAARFWQIVPPVALLSA